MLLFNSPESAYVWMTEEHADPAAVDRILGVERLVLMPDEFIEAEWRGCEYVYDGSDYVRFDLIRFAKVHQPENASGMLVSIHFGWVNDRTFPFRAFKDNDIEVRPLLPEEKKIDLDELFKDSEDSEDSEDE